MFFICFLVFTLIFTLFENISLAGIFLVIIVFMLIVYQMISTKKTLNKKMIWSIVGGFFLAMVAFGMKEWRYYGDWTSSSYPRSSREMLIGTGRITDLSRQWTYIFSYFGDEYLLYSEKEYAIGDELRLVGTIQKNMRNSWFSYRNISTWTFVIPLFTGAFDFNRWVKMKGRKGVIYETNARKITAQSLRQKDISWIQQIKKTIQEKTIEAYGKNRISGLLLGMLIGDRSQIPESEYKSFIDSWLVHLIAVSGGNILMIIVFLHFLLFFLPFYVRVGIVLCTIVGYSLICGLDSSVFRAVLMGGINMIAIFRGREVFIWRLLSISAGIMLMINPYFLAYDTGFLLSYSALIGIIYFEKHWKVERGELRKWVVNTNNSYLHPYMRSIYKNYISPSIWASIGIFPIIIFFMSKINLLSILGNLLVLPIVPFVMIYGFISVILFHRWWQVWMLWIEKICLQYIYTISDLTAQYGIYFMVSWLWFKYLVVVVFLVLFVMWRIKEVKKPPPNDPQ